MKLACVFLSPWAAAAAASKQPGRSSSTLNFEDGSRLETSRKTQSDVRSVYCDPRTEETCYDESYNAVSCSLISEGGCPCPEGLLKCGADLANGCVGWCTDVCCDWATEYGCYPSKVCAKYDGDGCPCPEDQQECWIGSGICSSICCDSDEESCYGPDGYTVSSCAKIADGGCPCPDGQEKCGAEPAYNYTGWCEMECCNSTTQETCYEYEDDVLTNQYCRLISEGGCPCPDGQKKCGADPAYNYAGWCQMECCDDTTQETCYEYKDDVFTKQYCKSISEGGCPCPTGQTKCGANLTTNYPGYCTDVCCDFIEQETCYDPPSCAPISSGGCPCPTGQTKCGADPKTSYAGYCTYVCCNSTQELCYNSTRCADNEYCAEIADGGCPCPEGLTRCGADLDKNIVGVCNYICCNTTTQETCYAWDDSGNIIPSCALIADGGCPCPDGYEKCGADLNNEPYCAEIAAGGCPKRSGVVSYLHHLETTYEKLPAMSGDKDSFLEKFAMEQKIAALRHSIKLNAAPAQLSMDKNPEHYTKEKN